MGNDVVEHVKVLRERHALTINFSEWRSCALVTLEQGLYSASEIRHFIQALTKAADRLDEGEGDLNG